MARLTGKVAIITGAGSGIARAATTIFAHEGAQVIAAEINPELGESSVAAARKTPGEATFVQTDVTDDKSVAAMVETAMSTYGGKIDILFNCAGGSVADDKPVAEVDIDLWQHTMDLDLKGPFLCCRHVIPVMLKQGHGTIINVSSAAALKGMFPAHIYSAAKGGVLSLTRSLAGTYSQQGIRANVICPGLVLSERIRTRFGHQDGNTDSEQAASVNDRAMKRYPFGTGEPEDIASIALFLASDESRMINGAVIPADGGMHAY